MLDESLLTGDSELKVAKNQAHDDLLRHFNEWIADTYVYMQQELMDANPRLDEAMVTTMLLLKSVLFGYTEGMVNEGREKEIPIDLMNVGYNLEVCLANLSKLFIDRRGVRIDGSSNPSSTGEDDGLDKQPGQEGEGIGSEIG